MLANATAALVVGDVLGLDVHRASALLETFGAGEGRGEVIRLGSPDQWLTIIDESYNANPASMRAALDSFAQRPAESGRRILVLGDMLELGAHAAGLHKSLAAAVEAANADLVFLVGPEMRALAEALGETGVAGWAHSAEEIEDAVLIALALGDTVMIKGSNGVRLSSLVARIRREFGESAAS